MLQKTKHFPSKINSLKNRLHRLHEITLRNYPALVDSIPSSDSIDLKKLGQQHGIIMTDSCDPAQKARWLLQHAIGGGVF
jgi:hypothetical protein